MWNICVPDPDLLVERMCHLSERAGSLRPVVDQSFAVSSAFVYVLGPRGVLNVEKPLDNSCIGKQVLCLPC